ncbi:hypothetical protein Micbo1qcDRAFT_45145 [Microdochium bolleyi]|uniref:Uncharacterized protein n=1 Tax=Microdochium bolleyi TaxID=196109 RepID=A0A136JBS1_9PEZI|nr:hypothetical protein Micbo1qcDRAFT_45145 [Microdochium bolleyi]
MLFGYHASVCLSPSSARFLRRVGNFARKTSEEASQSGQGHLKAGRNQRFKCKGPNGNSAGDYCRGRVVPARFELLGWRNNPSEPSLGGGGTWWLRAAPKRYRRRTRGGHTS